MKDVRKILYFSILALLLGYQTAGGEVKLPALISDNMVLQQEKPIRIWGWADPEEKVTVTIENHRTSTVTGADGRWFVKFDPIKAGGPYEMTVAGMNTVVLDNILVGEVWVCSGQSNMHWPVKYSANPEDEIANGNHPGIRLFKVAKRGAADPAGDCEGRWDECTFRTVGDFSAVGYFFGRDIMNELDVPVGLIQNSWGGTPAEAWTSLEALRAKPELKPVLKGWEEIIADKPVELVDHYDLVSAWFEFAFVCMGQKKPYGKFPDPPEGFDRATWVPSWLYNAMVAPLTPYSIRGVIWYQGESNSGRAYRYRTLFPTLINDWRRQWGMGDFPFLFVQLANFLKRETEPSESAWAELREAQLMTLDLPNTGMAVTIDLGEADEIHYKNKQDVGHRLALSALNIAYNRDIVHSGPLYDSMEVRGNRAHIRFTNTGSGLVTSDGGSLRGFAIAGSDSVFVWAEAEIRGDEVVVWNDNISKPSAVRYAWGNNPACNLYNREGLPASPFRTDNWTGITFNK